MNIPQKVLEAIQEYHQGKFLSDELFDTNPPADETAAALRTLYDIALARNLIIEVEQGSGGKTLYRWFRADIAVRYIIEGGNLIQKERNVDE